MQPHTEACHLARKPAAFLFPNNLIVQITSTSPPAANNATQKQQSFFLQFSSKIFD